MNRERAADESDASRASAELLETFGTGAYNLRVVAQAEVVVRRKNQHVPLAFHLDASGLRRVQVIEALVHAVLLQLLDARLELVVKLAVESHQSLSPMRSRRLLCRLRRI